MDFNFTSINKSKLEKLLSLLINVRWGLLGGRLIVQNTYAIATVLISDESVYCLIYCSFFTGRKQEYCLLLSVFLIDNSEGKMCNSW